MSDLISRQAAIEVLRNRWLKTRNYEGIGEDIAEECEIYLKTLPSAQSEIIRCKDCEYYKTKQRHLPWKNSRRYCNRSVILAMNPDDFCSRAERRRR